MEIKYIDPNELYTKNEIDQRIATTLKDYYASEISIKEEEARLYIENNIALLDNEAYEEFINKCPAKIFLNVMHILYNADIDIIHLMEVQKGASPYITNLKRLFMER